MGRSVMDGGSDGEWSVFAMKVVEERDALQDRVARLREDLEEARTELRRMQTGVQLLVDAGSEVTGTDLLQQVARRVTMTDALVEEAVQKVLRATAAKIVEELRSPRGATEDAQAAPKTR